MPNDELKYPEAKSSGMIYTNRVDFGRKYTCNDDCEQSGCHGHILKLEINNTAGVARLTSDNKELLWLDSNLASALFEILTEVQER